MCAIAGCYGSRDKETIKQMLAALDHGGEEQLNIYSADNMVWGHCSFVDAAPADDQQPIVCEDGSKGIIASGEIYNFQTIRQRFEERHAFVSHCEAEVILALYDQRGPDGVRDLDGMFAFALFDKERDIFMLARDPIGIKPLYYGYRHDTIYFSSERRPLKLAGVDEAREFPPGHYYTPTDGFIRYYNLPKVDSRPLRDEQSIGLRIRERLTCSVKKRLQATTASRMGAFCSGGLNSSLVAALARPELDEFHTFCVGMDDAETGEAPDLAAARRVAAHIGSSHHELIFDEADYRAALPRVIGELASYDPALIRSAVPCYFASRLASKHVEVVLSGEGADELFAGYHYMKHVPLARVNEEGRRCLANLHDISLQRIDRMALSFNLEQRIPFLDKELIALAMKIPADLKIKEDEHGSRTGKWILRQAFADSGLLPADIVWRYKEPLTQGAGCELAGTRLAAKEISDQELNRLSRDYPWAALTSKEMALYFKIFLQTDAGRRLAA